MKFEVYDVRTGEPALPFVFDSEDEAWAAADVLDPDAERFGVRPC